MPCILAAVKHVRVSFGQQASRRLVGSARMRGRGARTWRAAAHMSSSCCFSCALVSPPRAPNWARSVGAPTETPERTLPRTGRRRPPAEPPTTVVRYASSGMRSHSAGRSTTSHARTPYPRQTRTRRAAARRAARHAAPWRVLSPAWTGAGAGFVTSRRAPETRARGGGGKACGAGAGPGSYSYPLV